MAKVALDRRVSARPTTENEAEPLEEMVDNSIMLEFDQVWDDR